MMCARPASAAAWLVLAWFASSPFSLAAAEQQPVDFNRDIRPILSNTCYACHGPDEKQRKAGLRLDLEAGALARLESGAIPVVPGRSIESELVRRIMSDDPNEQMPPAGGPRPLTRPQAELLKRWVDEGAKWRGHWSFTAPVRAELPVVKQPALVRNSIDNFTLARGEREGLTFAPAADKVTLIRRVTLDLTGVPPTPSEVDAFLSDSTTEAYEKVVDRLLQSPRFGEHVGRYWLDAVRYGDTHGLHFDNERSLWMYREWVIDAINDNKPFDQFTIEQMAGDLLPNATIEQKIASGYNRCNVTTSEGGSINDEVLMRYNVDRVEALSTVWLGMTLGCAVCHDHKYDPFTQKDFYQLFAFFNGIAENAMDGNAISPPPMMKVPTAEQTANLAGLEQKLAAVRQSITAELAKVEYSETTPAAPTTVAEPQEVVWIDDAVPAKAKAQGPWNFAAKPSHPVFSGEKSSYETAEALSQHFFTEADPPLRVGEGDKLFAYVYLDLVNAPKSIMLQFNDGNWEHRAYWGEDVIQFGAANTPGHVHMGPLPEFGQWVRLEVEAAKVGLSSGAAINGWAFTQFGGTVYWDKAGIVTRTPQNGQTFESLIAWETYQKAQTKSTLPQPIQDVLKVEADKRNDAQKKQIRDYFLEYAYVKSQPVFEPLHQQVTELEKQRTALDTAIPVTMVAAELPQPRDTFVLIRGAYDKRGDKVTPGVPSVLPPLPAGATANRLGLAQWLVDPANPLTARVIVNRYWQQFFGTGIVKTAEDFGAQGEWPTNPELLDWLATEFIRSGWNVKHMQKLIVMSTTYQQSSRVSPELLQRDPHNDLLARGPRFRLDAEMIRDSALAIGGLLSERVGGRSVKPYQPEGLWEAISFRGSNTGNYVQDKEDSLYRRSLYTFWKRTSPPASLLTFDAPSRETCTVRRARTNTPLQALVLMNDKQYVEAARRLAERMLTEGGATPAERITHGFRLATCRRPEPSELSVLQKVYESELADFKADADAAAKLLAYGDSPRNMTLDPADHAALTLVANLILNLDETVTKE